MDITTFLEILVFLSWPVIALGYPLFASIMAVKNDSKDQMRKLVKYWVIFSLFALFEFAFVKITEGIPYWSSVRLVVIICCLVMTQFKGACLAYQGLALTVLFVKRLCQRETVPDVVQNNTEEIGSAPLATHSALKHESQTRIDLQRDTKVKEQEGENSAATSKQHVSQKRIDLQRDTEVIDQEGENSAATSKQHEDQKCIDIQRDTKVVIGQEGENSSSTSKQVKHTQPVSVARDLMGAFAAAEMKYTMSPKEPAEKRSPVTPHLKKAQQDKGPSPSATDGNVAEKHIKDSGSEEKLIPLKTERGERGKSYGDVQVVESKERNGPASHVTWLPRPSTAAEKDIMPPKETAEKRSPVTPFFKKAQQDKGPSPLATTKVKDGNVAEKLIKDSGSEGKLFANKTERGEPGKSHGDVQVVESNERSGPASHVTWLPRPSTAAEKDIMPPKETAEKRSPVSPFFKKAQQDKGPSPSAIIKLKDGNVAEKLSKDSGSEGKLISCKTVGGERGKSHGDVQIVESKDKSGPAAPQDVHYNVQWLLNPEEQHAQSVKVSAAPAAAVDKGITQPKELAEDRCPKTPLVKKAQQDKGPSPSAIIKLKDGNVAEKLSKDSGSEGKLIASKTQTKHGEYSNSHGDVQIVESKEKNGPPASQQYASDEVKENTPPKAQQELKSEIEFLETSNVVGTGITDGPFPKWCTVCRVKLSCDYYVTTHLKGKKHISNTKLSQKNGEP